MEFNGLPIHPLVIHAAVVLIPLAAVTALAYAGIPRLRWATRWPMVVTGLGALGAVLAAYFTGKDFIKTQFPEQRTSIIELHEERAEVLLWLTVVFVVFVLAAAWGLGGPSALTSGRGARDKHASVIEWTLVAMVVVLAISLFLMTAYTGEAGARSVWG